MYRKTEKKRRKELICKRMREGRERKREQEIAELGPRDPIYQPPELRRIVIVIDYDIEPKIDVFRMFRTERIDTYRVTHNHKPADRSGWSNMCKRLSTHYPRLLSPMAM